jgi:hypothetical protein
VKRALAELEARQMAVGLDADRLTFKRSTMADFVHIRPGRWTAKHVGAAAPMPREATIARKNADD